MLAFRPDIALKRFLSHNNPYSPYCGMPIIQILLEILLPIKFWFFTFTGESIKTSNQEKIGENSLNFNFFFIEPIIFEKGTSFKNVPLSKIIFFKIPAI